MNDTSGVMRTVAADKPLLDHYGIEFVSAADGRCVLKTVVSEAIINAAGFAHGGLAFAMADIACAYAVRSTGKRGLTVNGNMTYVNGVKAGMALESCAEILKKGSRVVSLRAEVSNGQELVAHGTFTFMLVESEG